jgi:PAS domain S-box-containing protein
VTQALTTNSATMPQPQPSPETLHLRRFIEKQPACILRVGLDATLLAVNDAALSLVGADRLAQVLGTKLTRFITPRQQDEWEEFASRVKEGASASIECDLSDMAGTRRTILLQGVPLPDHPDGVPSMILSARDISAPRRLEMALREREVNRELQDLQKQLETNLAERTELATSLTEREDNHQHLIAEHAAEQARLRQTLAEHHEMALLRKEQETRQLVDGLRSDLDRAVAEKDQLAAALTAREAEQQRIVATHTAERARLLQSLAEEHQLALILKERDTRGLVDSLKTELEKSLAERDQATAAFEEREALHKQAIAEHAMQLEQLAQVLEQERQLVGKEREGRELLENVKAQLETSLAERQRLTDLLADLRANHEKAVRKEQEGRELLENVKAQLETSLTERQRLSDSLADLRANHEKATAEHRDEHDQLQQTLAEERKVLLEERQLLQKEREGRQALEGLKSALEHVQDERERLEASLGEREAQHQRRLAELATEHAQRQLEADEELRALLAKEQDARRLLESVRTDLQQAVDDRQRLVGLLDDREEDHQRLLSEQVDARADAERKLATVMHRQTEIEKSLADTRVELQSVDENARHLEWLAAVGRAAREIGRDLQTVVEAVDARTRYLLEQSPVDSGGRHVLESLRGDAIGAASLVRQIVHAGDGTAATHPADPSGQREQPSGEGDRPW